MVSLLAAAGLTEMPESVPVTAEFEVSVAVIDWLPAVFSVTVKVAVPSFVGGELEVARQAGLGIGAAEADRAGVAGVSRSARVLGGDREAERLACGLGRRSTQDQRVMRSGSAGQGVDDQVGDRRAQASDIVVTGAGRVVGRAGACAGGDVMEGRLIGVEQTHDLRGAGAVERRLAVSRPHLVGDGDQGRPLRVHPRWCRRLPTIPTTRR